MKHAIQGFSSRIKLRGMVFLVAAFIVLSFSQKVLSGQTETGSFSFEGRERNYEVYLPQNFQSNMPVIFALHGGTETIGWFKNYTLFNEVSDTSGFIIVYPCGVAQLWNNGIRRGIMNPDTTVNDVGFISALIDTVHTRYAIDLRRIYCCGFSMGGAMSYRLACELAHRFAAIACVGHKLNDVSASMYTKIRPIPILHIHGTNDAWAVYGKGPGSSWTVNETLDFWIQKNECTLEPVSISLPDLNTTDNTTVDKFSYTDCSGGVSILFYKVINGGHSWPGCNPTITFVNEGLKNYDINANEEIWNFFKNYENPLVNIAYGKSIEIPHRYLSPQGDTLIVNARLTNPQNHSVSIKAFIQGDQSTFSDSLQLFDDGLHSDGTAADNLYGESKWLSGIDEDIYEVTLRTSDLESDITTYIYFPSYFTTIGPVVFENYAFHSSDTVPNPGDRIRIKLTLKNNGATATATNIEARLIGPDTLVNIVTPNRTYGDIAPGEMVQCKTSYTLKISEDCPVGTEIPFELEISSYDIIYWYDTFSVTVVPTAVSDAEKNIPKVFSLKQNYPNPFNPTTTIRFELPKSCFVTLKIYDLLGKEITTLVNEKKSSGEYAVEWNGKGLPSGIYLYRLKTWEFTETRKLVLQR